MNEKRKTIIWGGIAIGLVILALITTPGKVTPHAFLDQGELFFKNFQDPNQATSLEVINFDKETGNPIPFKVVFEKGTWSIPSHYDYPADGKDQLSKTAARVMLLKKDDFRSDNISDHKACGVLDPLDTTSPSLEGKGKRITIQGNNGQLLADIIVGKEVPEREGFRFVRVPSQKRVYASRVDLKISTQFSDWIESDLLSVEKDAMDEIILKNYSINEKTGAVNQRDMLTLKKTGDIWNADRTPASQELDQTKTKELLSTLDELSIVGIRPKPHGLSQSLKKIKGGVSISRNDLVSLQSKGYFFSREGILLSNEGELQTKTTDGITYTLRFGEIAYGSGFEVSAGSDSVSKKNDAPAENRYLFITAEFNPGLFKEPPRPANTDFLNKADSLFSNADHKNKSLHEAHETWKQKLEKGKKRSQDLNERFAKWYYVISDENFKKLNLTRKELLKKKEPKKKAA